MIYSNCLVNLYNKYKDEFDKAVIGALDSGYYVLGKSVEMFEKQFANKLNAKYCVGVANGLEALEISLKAYDLYNKDYNIIVPSNTYIATVLSITNNNLIPNFVEPDEYYNIDVSKIESRINNNTRAIMSVNLYGQACNMESLRKLCDKYKLYLIEDCAQSHFAKYENHYTNHYSDISCFSFYPSKNLGAYGDAGAIVLDDEIIYKKIKALRNYGSEVRYYNKYQGCNSRLDELQAALLCVKLKHIDEISEERKKIASYYLNNIKNNKISLPKILDKSTHVWHLFVIQTENRDNFVEYMKSKDIQILIHYPVAPHLQECYRNLGYNKGDFPIAEKYANSVATLPLYNGMKAEEYQYVVECINNW